MKLDRNEADGYDIQLIFGCVMFCQLIHCDWNELNNPFFVRSYG